MNIIVYCGASTGNDNIYKENAVEVGEWIAAEGHGLVYGGGKVGLMGILADTVLDNGGEVIGVMPEFLNAREISHPRLTDLLIVENMSIRKNELLTKGDVCVALPGGPGTLEEISEVISWARIGQNDRPCIFYNSSGYYDLLEQFFYQMVATGFLTTEDREMIYFVKDTTALEQAIKHYKKPAVRKYK